MKETVLYFNKEDEGLNLSGTVKWRDEAKGVPTDLSIRGLGKWRHFPANILACSERAIDELLLIQKVKKINWVGINYIGMTTKTDIMIPKSLRTGRNATEKVKNHLSKFFKALGASSVKFETPNL